MQKKTPRPAAPARSSRNQGLWSYTFENSPPPRITALQGRPLQLTPIALQEWVYGFILVASLLGAALLSSQFDPQIPILQQPVIELTVLLMFAGFGYLLLVERLIHLESNRRLMIWILAAGALLRGLFLFSTPILEVDFHRYLWDGAVTANGFNPYQFSPLTVQDAGDEVPQALVELSLTPESSIEQINHPHIKSIYPPLTQAAFALAYFLRPWSLNTWRFLLIVADLAVLVLLLLLLRKLRRPPFWIAVYWLNPLIIKEIHNSAHMDSLIYPFVLGAVYLSLRHRHYSAVGLLAGAVGIKIWPAILLPLFLKRIWPGFKHIAVAVVVFGITSLIVLAPLLISGLDSNAGVTQYSQRWELNDSLFFITLKAVEGLLLLKDIHPGHAQFWGRIVVMLICGLWTVWLTLRLNNDSQRFVHYALLAVAGLFLFSPTQFPWYSTWMIPLLALVPRRSLLLFSALMPIYYLRYYLEARGNLALFDNWIVWLEHLPVWILLLTELHRSRREIVILAG